MNISIEMLRQVGVTDAQIVALCDLAQKAASDAAEAVRTYERDRKRRWRSNNVPDVPGTVPDSRAPAHEESSFLSFLSSSRKEERKTLLTSSVGESEGKCTKGTRLPQSWEPNEASQIFALDRLGSPAAVHDQLEAFRDYWQAHAGPTARKRDWEAAWRNWCRKAKPSRHIMSPRDRQLQESYDVRDAIDAYVATHDDQRRPSTGKSLGGLFSFKFDRTG